MCLSWIPRHLSPPQNKVCTPYLPIFCKRELEILCTSTEHTENLAENFLLQAIYFFCLFTVHTRGQPNPSCTESSRDTYFCKLVVLHKFCRFKHWKDRCCKTCMASTSWHKIIEAIAGQYQCSIIESAIKNNRLQRMVIGDGRNTSIPFGMHEPED